MNPSVAKRYAEMLDDVHRRRDRVFAWLMAVQWIAAVAIALTVSPRAWAGRDSAIHIHVYYAIGVGGALSGSMILLGRLRPGAVATRHLMAAAQMLWSALLIHLTGGRIESHFHVFGSLAFLAFYRDIGVLATGSAVVVIDHLLRGVFWADSVYGIGFPEWWRFLEHAVWVVFEDVVLVMGIREHLREMHGAATRQTELEDLNAGVERKVVERTRQLGTALEQLSSLVESTGTVPWQFDRNARRFTFVGAHAGALLGCASGDWLAPAFWDARVHPDDRTAVATRWDAHAAANQPVDIEFRMRRNDGTWVWIRSLTSEGDSPGVLKGFMFDITERHQRDFELQQSVKLEAVGRLASGIAHEINTPIQFVGDSIHFISEAVGGLFDLIAEYRGLHGEIDAQLTAAQRSLLTSAEEKAELEYMADEVPSAIGACVDGLQRVSTLVRAMKAFAHPDRKDKTFDDLNRGIQTTLAITRNEYKYVADVETNFGELPPVRCHMGELNQAFLNLMVNAAHAIGDRVKGTEHRGRITVTTRRDGDQVVITVADTGGGIPEDIRGKIFDPFFTTKEVGRGTGQGLAIVRSVVVDKHGGTVSFESEMGRGTTFTLRLPIDRESDSAAAA